MAKQPTAGRNQAKPVKGSDFLFKIAYCTQCKPAVIVAAGPFDKVLKHRVKDGVHTSIKSIAVKEEWLLNEQPAELIARMQKKYQAQLK